MRPAPAIVWFRRDLRLSDNPALSAAAASGAPLIALYVLDEPAMDAWRPGGASRWWLHQSLASLSRDLASRGVELVSRRGAADLALEGLIEQTGATAVYWNRLYEPWAVRRDGEIKTRLRERGLRVESFNASLLFEPATLGKAYRVFTPFWRACLKAPAPATPLPTPERLVAVENVAGERLEDWRLLPTKPDWAAGFRDIWRVGESAARERLEQFAEASAADYGAARDAPAQEGVSRLSPHLHFGEISPRQVWHEIVARVGERGAPFLRQLGWREFCHHLLFANPDLPERPLDRRFERFPLAVRRRGARRLEEGPDRLSVRRRGDAAVVAHGLYPQPRAHGRGVIPGEASAACRGGRARLGSGICWSTPISPTMRAAGNGSPAAAPTPRLIFACSTRSRRARNSIPRARMCIAISRNWPRSTPNSSTARGRRRRRSYARRAWRLGETYPRPIVDHAFARKRALEAYAGLSEVVNVYAPTKCFDSFSPCP